MKLEQIKLIALTLSLLAFLLFGMAFMLEAQSESVAQDPAQDPGVRGGPSGGGGSIVGLSRFERVFFLSGKEAFEEVQSVSGTIRGTEDGLGPRFNLDSCAGCHSQPATGGSSPFVNPQVEVAKKAGALNDVPFFITKNGPVREARFKFKRDGTRDGGVHNLYTIAGRVDAPGCSLSQPNFRAAADDNNLIFRIPVPVFGAGLIEAIPDAEIIANKNSDPGSKGFLGIQGHPNKSGNDGTITRFGWKAQNKSLELFAGEAYNVEQGVTNDLFPHERDETPECLFNETPENMTNFRARTRRGTLGDVTNFATFMRFLASPTPVADTPSIVRGRALFNDVGCALCHTPFLTTGAAPSPALSGKQARLFSDLLLHKMGPGLADNIIQADAGPDEFRTSPLWGLGQRIFFLHDGRTTNLVEAIQAHASPGDKEFPPSEANAVIANFNQLLESEKQDILYFLRGL